MPPEFLCIGAQKCGTTWLYANLLVHPGVWLPFTKEIHYFDRSHRPYVRDLVGLGSRTRRRCLRWLNPAIRDSLRHPKRLGWYLRFFCFPRNDRWYRSLFRPQPGQIAGDITPGYARLGAERVERVSRLLPDARIIFMIRHPLERMWSQAAQYFGSYGSPGLDASSREEVIQFLNDPRNLRNSDYLTTFTTWEKYYPARQFLVVFMEQLEEAPAESLRTIWQFLGLADSPDLLPPSVGRRVHSRSYPPMPAWAARTAAARLQPGIQALHERFRNRHTERWRADAERFLALSPGEAT